MRRARVFLATLAFLFITLVLFMVHARQGEQAWRTRELTFNRALVRQLTLTDLALWTEARYTRHPSLADFFAPFQDSPAAFEHFPAGSIIAPRLPGVTTSLGLQPSPERDR